jgi:nucleoid DNA-binding protein
MKPKAASKKVITKDLSKAANMPLVQASFVYDLLFNIMIKRIKAGQDVIMPNLGTLRLVKGREMRSNLTGVTVPPHRKLRFKTNISLARFIRVSTREYPIGK